MNVGVIVAAGSGTRMAGPLPKQYLQLAGRPILAHAIERMAACSAIQRMVLAVPRDDFEYVQTKILASFSGTQKIELVAGGQERQESVANALTVIPAACRIVAIHDGVRPLVRPAHIAACIEAAEQYGAAILATPAFDTLKRVDKKGCIQGTIPRQQVWLAQTPQAFGRELIQRAHAAAQKDGISGTDDAGLVERLGHRVKVVPGSRNNIKVTTPEDLQLSEAIHQLSQ